MVSFKASPKVVPLVPIVTTPVDSSIENGDLDLWILKVLVLVIVLIYSDVGKSFKVSPLEKVVT